MSIYRIHGDNIVECERIVKVIIDEVKPSALRTILISPSTIAIEMRFQYLQRAFLWHIELLPGFNKAGRRRWEGNIFDALRDNGSFLEETPDAIITKVENGQETILCAIEFCSALQAGNQAWQRSGRAFSTGRTGCPYLYIVDFVKYELDSTSRERKALRFPNPAVPYSYISFSRKIDSFIAQVYVKSEEFDKSRDTSLADFDEGNFAEKELAAYIVKTMCGFSTDQEKEAILRKNMNVVKFLARNGNPKNSFTAEQWEALYDSYDSIIKYSLSVSSFCFHKTITAKGHHGKSKEVLNLIDGCSVGLTSRDLPFGIIPASKRLEFAQRFATIYPSYDRNIINKIASDQTDLVICIIKGFKPGGDDNRPDRGVLPLAVMLAGADTEIMTYIYGPVIKENYQKLISDSKQLANTNGLWKSILAFTDYLALDVPIIAAEHRDEEVIIDTSELKRNYQRSNPNKGSLTRIAFSSVPREFHEDDVDTGIHFLFAHLLKNYCSEGMCNPPGGDWSGMSIWVDNFEVRWLSLPRVSGAINGKRPDHVIEIYNVFDKPVLLAIESKERAIDLEKNVGTELINYVRHLVRYKPSVERIVNPQIDNWRRSDELIEENRFIMISAAAYLKSATPPPSSVFMYSQCEMLFVMEPLKQGWNIEIICNSPNAKLLKLFIRSKFLAQNCDTIRIL